jgi:hypothetical protein
MLNPLAEPDLSGRLLESLTNQRRIYLDVTVRRFGWALLAFSREAATTDTMVPYSTCHNEYGVFRFL